MRYLLLENFDILNEDANFIIGEVRSTNGREGPFRVFARVIPDDCGMIEVATVKSFEECVIVLADYYEKNPPQWVRRSAGWYQKETLYSSLCVEQDQRGRWRVYRDDYPMLQYCCRPATFSTCAEAQRAADAHQLDCYPNAAPQSTMSFRGSLTMNSIGDRCRMSLRRGLVGTLWRRFGGLRAPLLWQYCKMTRSKVGCVTLLNGDPARSIPSHEDNTERRPPRSA
jgi:hypothetical protein